MTGWRAKEKHDPSGSEREVMSRKSSQITMRDVFLPGNKPVRNLLLSPHLLRPAYPVRVLVVTSICCIQPILYACFEGGRPGASMVDAEARR
jgi:hypothetical protein